MSANRLYLVCSHHTNPEDSLLLADRAGNDVPYLLAKLKRADDWFTKHMACGTGCDHFKLGYNRPQNWDVSPPDVIGTGVRLALINGGDHAD